MNNQVKNFIKRLVAIAAIVLVVGGFIASLDSELTTIGIGMVFIGSVLAVTIAIAGIWWQVMLLTAALGFTVLVFFMWVISKGG